MQSEKETIERIKKPKLLSRYGRKKYFQNFLQTYQKFPSRYVTRLNYLDTNVIISFLNKRDTNHARALKIFDSKDRKVTSTVAVLELKSVLSGTTKLSLDEIEAFVDYFPENDVEVPEVDTNKIIRKAIEIAVRIRMKTLNLLHISASLIIEADTFITFNREFIEKEREIANIGLRIIAIIFSALISLKFIPRVVLTGISN